MLFKTPNYANIMASLMHISLVVVSVLSWFLPPLVGGLVGSINSARAQPVPGSSLTAMYMLVAQECELAEFDEPRRAVGKPNPI